MLRKLLTQAISVAGLRVAGTALSVGVSIAIARLFGAEALGIYAYCIALLALAAVPVSNGWSSMLLRAVSREGEVSAEARAMAWLGSGLAVAVAICMAVVAVLAIWLAQTEMAQLLRPIALTAVGLLAVVLIFDQISAMRMASIRGVDRPALAQIPEVLVRPSILLLCILLGWYFFGKRGSGADITTIFAAAALAAMFSFLIGQMILQHVIKPQSRSKIDPAQRRAWIASASALAGSAGLVQLNGYIDMLLLGSFAPASEVGLYRAALQIAMLASFGYLALNMLAGQRFSRFLKEGDRAGLAKTATVLARLALLTALPLPIIIWLAGPQVLGLLFGASFVGAAQPALIVSLGFCFSASIGMAHALLIMSHQEVLALRLTAAALLINVVLCFALIPPFGLVGAATANMCASIGWNILLWYYARQTTGIDTSALGLAARLP